MATPTMSSATARCGARDTNSIVHVLWRFFDNRKMTKSGCSRIHGVGCLPLLTVSMLLQVRSAIRRVFFASKFFFCSSSIHSHALLNFGEFTCFIDKSFVHSHNIPTICTSQPISIEAINGQVPSSEAVNKAMIPLVLQVSVYQEELTFYLITTPRHPIVFGLSWLETHFPTVDWYKRSITFPVRSILDRPRHCLDSIAIELVLVTTLALVSGDVTIPINNIAARYTDFFDIFEKWNVDRLLAHHPCNCSIESQAGEHPPFGSYLWVI